MVFLVLDSKRSLLETPLLFGMRALFWIVVTYLHTPPISDNSFKFLTGTICSSKVLSRNQCSHFGLTVTQRVKKAVNLYLAVLIQSTSRENTHMFLFHEGVTGRFVLCVIILDLPRMFISQISFKLLFW